MRNLGQQDATLVHRIVAESFASGDWWLFVHVPPISASKALTDDLRQTYYTPNRFAFRGEATWRGFSWPGEVFGTDENVVFELFQRAVAGPHQLQAVFDRRADAAWGPGRVPPIDGSRDLFVFNSGRLDEEALTDAFLNWLNNPPAPVWAVN